jgi:TonB family protein
LRARTALGAPLALSLAGHAGLLGVLALLWHLAGPAAVPVQDRVIPVARVDEGPGAGGPRLQLRTAAAEAPAAAAPEEAVVALDTADPRYRPYLTGVKERIWQRWSAPALPASDAARGVLVVEFTLTRGGRLAGAGVRESSGVPALDRAALEAVGRAVPFTPLPASIAGDSLRIRARFVYD